jgi:hypothetical protein
MIRGRHVSRLRAYQARTASTVPLSSSGSAARRLAPLRAHWQALRQALGQATLHYARHRHRLGARGDAAGLPVCRRHACGHDVPRSVFPFYFVVLGVAAFSFSPAMVMTRSRASATGARSRPTRRPLHLLLCEARGQQRGQTPAHIATETV